MKDRLRSGKEIRSLRVCICFSPVWIEWVFISPGADTEVRYVMFLILFHFLGILHPTQLVINYEWYVSDPLSFTMPNHPALNPGNLIISLPWVDVSSLLMMMVMLLLSLPLFFSVLFCSARVMLSVALTPQGNTQSSAPSDSGASRWQMREGDDGQFLWN